MTSLSRMALNNLALEAAVLNDMENEIQLRKYNQYEDAFEMSDKKFIRLFRLSKDLVKDLNEKLIPFMKPKTRSSSLDPEIKILAALRFFGAGSYQQDMGENKYISMSQPSVSRSITEVINAVHDSGMLQQHIQFPNTIEKLNKNRSEFYVKYGFPGVIGCIDCTHVAIFPPPSSDPECPEHLFVNRKGYHSINVQLICDANKKIIGVNAKFPGSTHDSHIWNNCDELPLMKQLHQHKPNNYFLLGDSGYALRPWMMTPLSNPDPDSPEARYNAKHCSTRSIIEQVNGILKMRFRCCLKHRTLHYHPQTAAKIINTCCILHNICIDNNMEDVPVSSDDDPMEGLYMNQHEMLNVMGESSIRSINNALLAEARRSQKRLINRFYL